MAITNRITTGGSIAGISMSGQATRSTTGGVGHNGPLVVAYAASMAYTSATSGTITVTGTPTHGLSTGELFDIFWTISGVGYCAYGAIAGVISPDHTDTEFTFTGSSGDAVPTPGPTAVTFAKQITLDIDFDADLMTAYGVVCDGIAHVGFLTAATVNLALYLPTNECQSWMSNQGVTNPLAGHVISSVVASQADISAAKTLRIGIGKNN